MHKVQKIYTKFTRSIGSNREKGGISLIYLDDIRETTTDLHDRHIDLAVSFLGFVDKIIWIRKDSISISWFWSNQQDSTSRIRSVWCLSLTAGKCLSSLLTAKKCLSLTAENVFGLTACIE